MVALRQAEDGSEAPQTIPWDGRQPQSNEEYLQILTDAGMKLGDAKSCLVKRINIEDAIAKIGENNQRFVEVQGDYVDEGWVDKSAPHGGGFFGKLFGGK
mmetsp:Transcript_28820/g.45192  ORF Transcript_28820/g.45192 Transcript_28820/m.45192 type:complete len:100 (+) Transcript_28820:464-763(+)